MKQKHALEPLFIGVPEAGAKINMTRQNVYLLAKHDPAFPKIIKLGRRKSGIFYPDLIKWAQEKARGQGGAK
jgi:predicted DNA-binding transcriptional regulator AlpA